MAIGQIAFDGEQCKISETEEEDDSLSGTGVGQDDNKPVTDNRQKMFRDLDETALMLEKLTQSLFPVK